MQPGYSRRILVTGAAGFVGQALCRLLFSSGHTVYGVLRTMRVCDLPYETVIVGEVNGKTFWEAALNGVDVVVHCAARVHVRNEDSDPLAGFREVNVAGTLALARQAAAAGVRRFVFVSSIKVNGESTSPGHPFRVEDSPAPEDAYGISKWEAEQGLTVLSAETGMEVVIIRPPLVYGPGVKGNFATLLQWVNKGAPLPFGAVTENRRSLVALDNLIDLMVTCTDHPAAAGQVFLVSDGEDVSTAELLRRVGVAIGKPVRLLPVPLWMLKSGVALLGRREQAQRLLGSLQVDISRTRERLGWTPPVSLDEGLRRTVASFRRR